jgi:NAD-dependent SIR2 family protein deacetylase
MTDKHLAIECEKCESDYEMKFDDEKTSSDIPEVCPFCGENIVSTSEVYIEDDLTDDDGEKWD